MGIIFFNVYTSIICTTIVLLTRPPSRKSLNSSNDEILNIPRNPMFKNGTQLSWFIHTILLIISHASIKTPWYHSFSKRPDVTLRKTVKYITRKKEKKKAAMKTPDIDTDKGKKKKEKHGSCCSKVGLMSLPTSKNTMELSMEHCQSSKDRDPEICKKSEMLPKTHYAVY